MELEELYKDPVADIPEGDYDIFEKFIDKLISIDDIDARRLEKEIRIISKTLKWQVNKPKIRGFYYYLLENNNNRKKNINLEQVVIRKQHRSSSGILEVTVFTSPHPIYYDRNGNLQVQMFSCKHDCWFCPDEIIDIDEFIQKMNEINIVFDDKFIKVLTIFGDRSKRSNREMPSHFRYLLCKILIQKYFDNNYINDRPFILTKYDSYLMQTYQHRRKIHLYQTSTSHTIDEFIMQFMSVFSNNINNFVSRVIKLNLNASQTISYSEQFIDDNDVMNSLFSFNTDHRHELDITTIRFFDKKISQQIRLFVSGNPRSYLSGEPGLLRAEENFFDPILQTYSRLNTHRLNGHELDKLEVHILGGTWSEYPYEYQKEFVSEVYYAANTYYDDIKRDIYSLNEEITINETAKIKIIGLTIETRPDSILKDPIREIEKINEIGCTRVQIGIQHSNNNILRACNRGHTIEEAIKCIDLLRRNCIKIDGHFMYNLPTATVEDDMILANQIISDPNLQVDQIKLYPFQLTGYSRFYHMNQVEPLDMYPYEDLFNVLLYTKENMIPQIRINRAIRDIPFDHILGGCKVPNARQNLQEELKRRGTTCDCIRCREVKLDIIKYPIMVYRPRAVSSGTNLFISFESPNKKKLCGYIRLFFLNCVENEYTVPTVRNSLRVRELHVYGKVAATYKTHNNYIQKTQHTGLGGKLLREAEVVAMSNGLWKISIIAGVGTRRYYRRFGYYLDHGYMIKYLTYIDLVKHSPYIIWSSFLTSFGIPYSFLLDYSYIGIIMIAVLFAMIRMMFNIILF